MNDGTPPRVRLPGFLDIASHDQLRDHVMASAAEFGPSLIDYGDVNDTIRASASAKLGKTARRHLIATLRARLPEILADLGMAPFDHQIETELVAYNDGAKFTRHADSRPDTGDPNKPRVDRRLSAVYYFFNMPKGFTGGELRLYPLLGDSFVDIEPLDNMLLAFPSFTPHEVLPVACPSKAFAASRFAINIWFHAAPGAA